MDQETPILGREKLGLHNLSKGSLSDLSTAAVHLAYDGMDEKQLRQLSFSVLSYEQDCKATLGCPHVVWLPSGIDGGLRLY